MYTELEQVYTHKNNQNIVQVFFIWWFSILPRKIIFISISYVNKLLRFFSISVLLRTLFSPWKRDIIDTRGMSLNDRLQVWVMNLISRLIGFIIRLVTIMIGLLFITLVVVACTLFLLIMLLMPLFILLVIILSLS